MYLHEPVTTDIRHVSEAWRSGWRSRLRRVWERWHLETPQADEEVSVRLCPDSVFRRDRRLGSQVMASFWNREEVTRQRAMQVAREEAKTPQLGKAALGISRNPQQADVERPITVLAVVQGTRVERRSV